MPHANGLFTFVILSVAFVTPAFGTALSGDFSGFADHGSAAPGVYLPGDTYSVRLTLDTTQENPWFPWDPSLEYTVVLETTVQSHDATPPLESVVFDAATVTIYEDGGTAALWSSPDTFADGTPILSGVILDLTAQRYDFFGMPWTLAGNLYLNTGSRLLELNGQCLAGLVMNDFVDFQFASPPAGFEEAYNAQWICPSGPLGVDDSTWGEVKARYR